MFGRSFSIRFLTFEHRNTIGKMGLCRAIPVLQNMPPPRGKDEGGPISYALVTSDY